LILLSASLSEGTTELAEVFPLAAKVQQQEARFDLLVPRLAMIANLAR
jgi:hypothetical protein